MDRAKGNKENAIKFNASFNSRTLNSLHQVNIMLLKLDLRMLLQFYRKLIICSEEEPVWEEHKLFSFLETSFKMGCMLYMGAHYTRVNTIIKIIL